MKRKDVDPIRRVKEIVAVFNDTEKRTIPAMSVVVYYEAAIARVERVGEEPNVRFITSRTVPGSEPHREDWEQRPLSAFGIRDAFLSVANERQALDFLRETGEFLPHSDAITWTDFQLWQRVAKLVHERKDLIDAWETQASGELSEMSQMLRLLSGYPHQYFGSRRPDVWSDKELADIRRAAAITASVEEGTRAAEIAFNQILRSAKNGKAQIEANQRELEEWFRKPPPKACSIVLIPSQKDEERVNHERLRGGGMIEFLRTEERLRPMLVIYPRCTLQAIAAACYAERIGEVIFSICPKCKSRFEAKNRKQVYCLNQPCKATMKKRRQRARKKDRMPETNT